jgi:hypothetical protein
MFRLRITLLAFGIVILFAALPAQADVPQSMFVQGQLTDTAGAPVAPGPATFTFRIFDSETLGSEVWPGGGETQIISLGADGRWTAELGAVTPLSETVFSADTSRWLEITVEIGASPPETLSRIRLQTNPYAFQAASAQVALNATQLGGQLPEAFATADHNHPPTDIDPQGAGSGLDADLLDGLEAADFAVGDHAHVPADVSPQGSGSGLNADLLDSLEAADFAVTDHGHAPVDISPQGSGSGLNADLLDSLEAADFAVTGHDHTPADITPQGTGSGLDADLLDGREAEEFADTAHGHAGLWSANGPNYYYDGGRVGIGTSSPEQLLHVLNGGMTGVVPNSGSIAVFEAGDNGYLSIITPDPTERGIFFGENASPIAGGIIYNNSLTPDGLQFRTAFNVVRMALESSGRLSIGSFTGAGMLQVTGNPVNSTVVLPVNSIASEEILNEPGLAASVNAAVITLLSTTMQTITSVTINIPTAGHIVVEGKANGLTHGTTGRNQGLVQIDETAGGAIISPYFNTFGLLGYVNTTQANAFPVYVTRTFFKNAGEHTFLLEASQQAANGVGAVTRVAQSMLTAVFYPTSYGDVNTVVSNSEAAAFEQATALSGESGGEGYSIVNLRELEREAARLRTEAEKAEQALLEAQRSTTGE